MLPLRPLRPSCLLHALVALLIAAACRSPSVPPLEREGCHPACPGALEASIGDAGASLRGAAPVAAPATGQGERPPSSAAYLCPMHVHVGSDQPGRCPECNMKLVPRAQALEHDHGD